MSLANRIEALLFTRDTALTVNMLAIALQAQEAEIEVALQDLAVR